MNRYLVSSLLVASLACGGTSVDPTDVKFGDTALVVVMNPAINEQNDRQVSAPGAARAGITLTTDDGVTAETDARGIAVLAPLAAGSRTVEVKGADVGGSFTVLMAAGALREVAVASQGATSSVMLDLDYKSDQVVEVTPAMTPAEVNAALKDSDRVVFFKSGSYSGDIDFSGSRVTLFGEGALGGTVTLTGNVTVSGSDSRIRGTTIEGDLTVPASGVGLTFSRVNGAIQSTGSDATFLRNALCGAVAISGSGTYALDNAGAPPIARSCE